MGGQDSGRAALHIDTFLRARACMGLLWVSAGLQAPPD
jgi:hypothetical protein